MTGPLKRRVYKPKWIKRRDGQFEYFPLEDNAIWWDDYEALAKEWTWPSGECLLLECWEQASPQYVFIESGAKL